MATRRIAKQGQACSSSGPSSRGWGASQGSLIGVVKRSLALRSPPSLARAREARRSRRVHAVLASGSFVEEAGNNSRGSLRVAVCPRPGKALLLFIFQLSQKVLQLLKTKQGRSHPEGVLASCFCVGLSGILWISNNGTKGESTICAPPPTAPDQKCHIRHDRSPF